MKMSLLEIRLHLFVGRGEKGEQQICQRHGVNEPLDPLDRGALCHDVKLSWWTVARPTLQRRGNKKLSKILEFTQHVRCRLLFLYCKITAFSLKLCF